ncbi:hypothetical protein [Bacillus sp. JCM 19034]|uniref:hypothetical protein n=1 Tax=Bacillus sp. JCM 19034 TaxID=1481928 RepID=UPI000786387D|nr:hypothetical protein [Bacillus sp. JCM 19034]
MFALSCFVVIVTVLLPIMTFIQQEYSANRQEREVLYQLENLMHYYMLTGDVNETADRSDVSYYVEQVSEQLIRVCASWQAVNEREYEHCFYVTEK